jgi:D-glycero-alpha-D-manno-heptose 1-phosphate guanylyltransferase
MKMLVLAGGFGTRLQSVVAEVPKAMAPVGSVPFLYLQIQHWIDQGVRAFVFLLHHQADQIIIFLEAEKSGLLKGCEVQWLIESTPMDTGGAVAYAVKKLNLTGDFLVTNADTWIGAGVKEVAQIVAPSMAVLNLSDASRYGLVKFDDQFLVTQFTEKSEEKGRGWINAGLCHLNVDLFKNWDGQPFSLERACLSALAGRGALKAVALQTDFIDIGIPSDYFRFCQWIAADRKGILCS